MKFHPMTDDNQGQDMLTAWDPRIKLIVIVTAIFIGISSKNLLVPLILILLSISSLLMTGRGAGKIIRKIIPVVLISLMVGMVQAYLSNYSVGTLLTAHMVTGASLILLLSETTTFPKLLFSLKYFRLPESLLEIITVTYRYIFVLTNELERVHKAQRMRFGYHNWRISVNSVGSLGGIAILRAFAKSEGLYKSMCCRGYQGKIQVNYQPMLAVNDLIPTCFAGVLLMGLITIGL